MKHLLIPILLVAFLLSPLPSVGASPISIKPSPDGAYYIGDRVTLAATIQRDKSDRKLTVALDCVGYYGQSTVDITEKSPSVTRVTFVHVPPGDCQGVAVLMREEDGKLKEYPAVTRKLTVYSEAPSFSDI